MVKCSILVMEKTKFDRYKSENRLHRSDFQFSYIESENSQNSANPQKSENSHNIYQSQG